MLVHGLGGVKERGPKTAIYSRVSDEDIAQALHYWYRKGTEEVKKFNGKDFISKLAIEKDGILLCRSRIMDGQRFIIASDLDPSKLGMEVNLNLMTPVLDRYSPISYSIAKFVHEQVCIHAGFETCYRTSLNYCHIIQGASLFKEIGEECSECSRQRKKFVDVVMGPVSDFQLTICHPFYVALCDLDGPYRVFGSRNQYSTRNNKVVDQNNWIMVFACPVTKLISLEVIECKGTEGVLCGLSRLACEFGYPKFLLLDQERSFVSATADAELQLKDLDHRCYKEHGIRCEFSPVGGHNFTGLVERKIRSVQETFDKLGLKNQRMNTTELQTLAKLVETRINDTPLGFSYGRDANNTPVLKLITPNLMRFGRNNSRAVVGPVKFPSSPKDMLVRIEENFYSYFKIWNENYIPKLIPQPKWFKAGVDLKPEDVVYFRKREGDFSSDWTVGQVESVRRSRDGVVRRADVRYFNHGEAKARTTDRAVRTICRLFNIEDDYYVRDMCEVEAMIKSLDEKKEKVPTNDEKKEKVPTVDATSHICDDATIEDQTIFVDPLKPICVVDDAKANIYGENAKDDTPGAVGGKRSKDISNAVSFKKAATVPTKKTCECCCSGHCNYSIHHGRVKGIPMKKYDEMIPVQMEFYHVYECNKMDDAAMNVPIKSDAVMETDGIYDAITSLETDFFLDSSGAYN